MQAVYRDLVPSGTMRAAVNFANTVMAQRDTATGQPRGLAVELVDELARRLAVSRAVLEFDAASDILEAGAADKWDLAFLAVDPVRALRYDFTTPCAVFEGTYIVRTDSPHRTVVDLDREGIRIAVSQGAIYDVRLTRTLRHAQLVRLHSYRAAVDLFLSGNVDAVAGLKQPLVALEMSNVGLRVIEGRFAAIEQAIAVPKYRAAGLRYLQAFVEEMRSKGVISAAVTNAIGLGPHSPTN